MTFVSSAEKSAQPEYTRNRPGTSNRKRPFLRCKAMVGSDLEKFCRKKKLELFGAFSSRSQAPAWECKFSMLRFEPHDQRAACIVHGTCEGEAELRGCAFPSWSLGTRQRIAQTMAADGRESGLFRHGGGFKATLHPSDSERTFFRWTKKKSQGRRADGGRAEPGQGAGLIFS